MQICCHFHFSDSSLQNQLSELWEKFIAHTNRSIKNLLSIDHLYHLITELDSKSNIYKTQNDRLKTAFTRFYKKPAAHIIDHTSSPSGRYPCESDNHCHKKLFQYPEFLHCMSNWFYFFISNNIYPSVWLLQWN